TISGNTHGLAIGDIIHGFEVIGVNLGRHGGDIGDIGQVGAGFIIEDILVRGVLVDVKIDVIFTQRDIGLTQVGELRVINFVALLAQDGVNALAEKLGIRPRGGTDTNLGGVAVCGGITIGRAARSQRE